MKLQSIEPAAFLERLAIPLGEDGAPDAAGLAGLMREATSRWGVTPLRDLKSYLTHQLDAAHVAPEVAKARVEGVYKRLVLIGELQETRVGSTLCVAPTRLRWVETGERSAVLLGGAPGDHEGVVLERECEDPIDRAVRRFDPSPTEHEATLAAAGAYECPRRHWIEAPEYLTHHARRTGSRVRGDQLSLGAFWGSLESAVLQHGQGVSADAELRVVVGDPGGFFGRLRGAAPEGRWSTEAPEGTWCGYRPGHNPNQWHPVLLSVRGGNRRILDLYDHSEWEWALIARANALGTPEQVRVDGHNVARFTFLPTRRHRRAMALIGDEVGAWAWRAPSDVEISGWVDDVYCLHDGPGDGPRAPEARPDV